MAQDPQQPSSESSRDRPDDEVQEYRLGIRRTYDGDDVVVFHLRGLIGSHAYESFIGLIRREHVVGKRLFVFDLAEVTYVNSSGLGFLVSTALKLEKAECRLALCRLQPRIQSVFRVSGHLPLDLHETLDGAIRALRG